MTWGQLTGASARGGRCSLIIADMKAADGPHVGSFVLLTGVRPVEVTAALMATGLGACAIRQVALTSWTLVYIYRWLQNKSQDNRWFQPLKVNWDHGCNSTNTVKSWVHESLDLNRILAYWIRTAIHSDYSPCIGVRHLWLHLMHATSMTLMRRSLDALRPFIWGGVAPMGQIADKNTRVSSSPGCFCRLFPRHVNEPEVRVTATC